MTEHGLINAMRRRLKNRVYWLKIQLTYVKGVPDVYLSGDRSDIWIEVKYLAKLPKVIDATKLLSLNQQTWLRNRHKEGRSTAVLIGSTEGCAFFPGDTWETSVSRNEFTSLAKSITVTCDELADLVGEVVNVNTIHRV